MAPSALPDLASALGQKTSSVTLLTDRLEKPSLDDRQYRVIRLENGLEALLVHDPDTDKASGALDVNVGSFSDEAGMPGMAHAVEHLLFMGTKKFPVENEYSQYLSSNGGSSNAYTASTSTNYYFDVAAKPANDEQPTETNPSPLYGALDRFAQFFIEPLFLDETLDRELRAVDSENKKNLQSDGWRLQQLEKSLSNPNHPYCHFSTGNFEVLKTIPESQGINVRDKFIEFHAKHYSANRMKLVVLGRESLDLLQKWTVQLFAAIVNKNLPQNRWTEEVPFRPADVGIQFFAKPVMDTREVNLTFPFIDEEELYEIQPSRYISHLIGHEGPGSIMSYIKSKGWANGLSAGGYSLCPGTPGIFDVQIRLTEEGLKNYPEIVKIFFQYVSLLRQSPPQEWIFQEQKGMADVDFKFKQKTPASRFTSKISSVMQKPLPREWLLSGHSLLRRFDAEIISKALALLRPESLRLNVVSRKFPGSWNKKEKWYGTEYTVGRIPDDLMAELKKAASVSAADRLPDLHLPHQNQFIPSKLEVEKKEVVEPATSPRLLRNDQLARTWWKKDDTFWVPKANVVASLKNPIIYATAENSVKARLFAELVRDALEEYSYDAELAGLQYTVSLDSRGLFLDVSGYNDKLPVLLEHVAVTMRDLEIQADRFDIVKERLTRSYNNWQLQSSYQQVGDYMSWLHAERDYLIEELAAELPAMTVDAVRSFQKQMLAQIYIEVYVHGNMYREDAIKATDLVASVFKPRILPHTQWPITRSLIIPPGSNLVYKKTLKDPANVNHCIETTFYVGDRGDRRTRARTFLVDQMIHEPAFDQLRSKEQLGYIVFAGMRNFATTCGVRFLIQSEREPEYLDRRVEAFLIQFGLTLDKMSDSEFESHKRSLINKRLEKLRNLDQESSRHWTQISKEYYDFEQAQLDAAEVKLVTKAEMVDFYNKYLHPSSTSRARIAVHLHARGAVERDNKVVDALGKAGFSGVPEEDRKSIDSIKAHLQAKHKPSEADLDSIVASIRELGLVQTAHPEDDAEAIANGGECAVDTTQEIKDVRLYKSAQPFKTSSSKKRKLASRPLYTGQTESTPLDSPSPDTALPSCETAEHDRADLDDAAFSFTTNASLDDRRSVHRDSSPVYLRSDSLQPASSLPARLQAAAAAAATATNRSSSVEGTNNAHPLTARDHASSAASSPCASAYADLSLDGERGIDEAGSAVPSLPRGPSPFRVSRRAIMNGDSELPQRSSSPLKRRASSMDPEPDAASRFDADVSMDSSHANTTATPTAKQSDGTRAMSVDPPETTTDAPPQNAPPLAEQIKIIETLLKAFEESPVAEGDKAYLVSRLWLNKARSLQGPAKATAQDGDVQPGPVDNSDIIDRVIEDPSGATFTCLKPGADQEMFALFPEDAWKLVVEWYGLMEGQEPIIRYAINSSEGTEANILYEFHPPVFRVHRVWSELSPLPIEQLVKAKNPPAILAPRSRGANLQAFLKDIKTWAGIPLYRKVLIHQVRLPVGIAVLPTIEPGSALTPPDSPGRETANGDGPWPNLLVDLPTFSRSLNYREKLDSIQDHTDRNYNSNVQLHMKNLTTDATLVLDEMIDNKFSVSTYKGQQTKPERITLNRTGLSPKPSSARSSPGPEGVMTRGRAGNKKQLGRSVGVVGLHNLGNTCYMNSALQCVRSVEELTKFFITGAYVDEINKTNLLGYNGRMASSYGDLLRDIYQQGRGSVSPRDFKSTVGRCRSTFSGWGQQDSQEFLGFLLDALQEDLSRVKNKPYIEKPDSTDEMIDDPEAIREMAAKVWDITRLRDDSVIADLFTGMYKSTLKCPECGKISITFDPFNTLPLPLPLETVWSKTVKFFPLNDFPVNIDVEIPKHSTIEVLKTYLSLRTGVPAERMMGAEEYNDRFFKIYDNDQDVSEEIQHKDVPTFHELESVPTNWPAKAQPQKYRSLLDIDAEPDDVDDPRTETMVVPVMHRRPSMASRPQGVPPPHFITLTREETSNFDAIQRKILEKIATFSTWSKLANEDEADGTDMDMVATSDADSAGDVKVAAKSVEGEDDLVDVTMKDAGTASTGQPALLKRFNTTRPKFVGASTPLSPSLKNLIELKYFVNRGDKAIPTGWQVADNNTMLPSLLDRMLPTSDKDEESATPESSNGDGSENEKENENEDEMENGRNGDDGASKELVPTRMTEESSEEDIPRRFERGGRNQRNGGRKKLKGPKTYGKRGNKRQNRHLRISKANGHAPVNPQPIPPVVADGGPLIRLHEGITVDWNEDTWNMVFGGAKELDSPAEGTATFNELESLQDPVIKINQRRRQTRKSRGITLDECLDEFERAEILSEHDMWYCPRCKEHRRASKKFDLWKTPDYLVAHLKRFSSSGFRRDKLDVLVDFPIEELDLTARVVEKEEGKSEVYDLIAVDDHYGGLGGGHYTAYAKNFVDGKWYNYNDSSVSLVSNPKTVISSAAYLLFYKRRASGHLGGPRFAAILDKYDKDTTEEESGGDDDASGKADGDLPSYSGRTLGDRQPSTDNESGLGKLSAVPGESLKQTWSFEDLDSGGEQSAGPASDVAQCELSEDDGNELDTIMDNSVVEMVDGEDEGDKNEVTEIDAESSKV
ncbi:Metalloenzyme, LuxS/M16 peptidase-like, metal-binding protein [Cordyceps fumosorosea ARSEF 2679]|uniref:Metalloenzyme, LuxS/M16 peptidase-like, metal-binding protein n=1 Tax=Cordyceps fumosorosea (strain ARSEF 2679) TaxID=1081104 RepID=A0A162N1R2_CORFA|nr:Metalloenzyme, LuxS/M16 peptidase-like, metal-binding protein [Cordyceps fumosorosea ARSEF 2679]OAA74109.1 Metalloenzyme, LuxS/M16 peptidase-like, metal-binding protein [Cordyceps fumosorosea ARSEF 2679]